jgi:RNA polymerase sigma-70 factor (ECF subfamily)
MYNIRLHELDFHATRLLFDKKEKQLEDIRAEIDKLPVKCREIFHRHYIKQESCARIAGDMDISPRTVEAQIYKALKTIRKALSLLFLLFR